MKGNGCKVCRIQSPAGASARNPSALRLPRLASSLRPHTLAFNCQYQWQNLLRRNRYPFFSALQKSGGNRPRKSGPPRTQLYWSGTASWLFTTVAHLHRALPLREAKLCGTKARGICISILPATPVNIRLTPPRGLRFLPKNGGMYGSIKRMG